MSSLEKRPNGKYRIVWREPGEEKKRYWTCGANKKAAQAVKREIDDCLAKGIRWQPKSASAEPGPLGVSDVTTLYLSHVRRVFPRTLRTAATRLGIFYRWCLERGYDRDVELAFTRRRLGEYYDDVRVGRCNLTGRPVSAAAARRYVMTVEQAWQHAFDDEEFGDRIPRYRKSHLPRVATPDPRAPTWDEGALMVGRARFAGQRQCYLTLYATGLRVDLQVMQLRRTDIDFEQGTLRVRPELAKTVQEGAGRVVPLAPWFLDEVQAWPENHTGFLVATWHDGLRKRNAHPRDARIAWRDAGVPEDVWKGQPHHAFRKMLYSGLAAAGISERVVDYLVGHQLRGQARHYQDGRHLDLRKAVEAIPDPRGAGGAKVLKFGRRA